MFVAMGLSAVFPIIHGMKMYGIENMRDRIGLSWLVLQGVLYILGAGLYAVSKWNVRSLFSSNDRRLDGQKDHLLVRTTFGEVPISYFTYWSS